ncbi:hypothetical protein N7474_007396 [Penicillium riverlandense]|uniref:uncharacterized protein n=1 Tax=Penicillium riverlandense TaxID=1903569 RepID=UPI0025491D2A|nr:uncharacterized protein N7474_007396 [Penicillium riverlandense]KAJ5815619.1 hypothetical protein N7474_007396 [Penicillium riverlandense]
MGGVGCALSKIQILSLLVCYEFVITHQLKDKSANDMAWIGSLAAFLQFAAGAIGGLLFDRYGALV